MPLVKSPAPSGQIVQARARRGFRIGGNDRDARLHQVAPILDSLWVPLAHQEYDGRSIGRAVFGQSAFPIFANQPDARDRLDVGRNAQRNDVGFQPVHHGTRLFARPAMRLLDDDFLARLFLPIVCKGEVERGVEFPRRVIRDVQQCRVGARSAQCAQRQDRRHQTAARKNDVIEISKPFYEIKIHVFISVYVILTSIYESIYFNTIKFMSL